MTLEQLADHWDNEASIARDSAQTARSLDHYLREHARADQMRQCAIQLRMVLGNTIREAAVSGPGQAREGS